MAPSLLASPGERRSPELTARSAVNVRSRRPVGPVQSHPAVDCAGHRRLSEHCQLDRGEAHADHVLVAPWSDSDFLSTLDIETEQESDGPVQEIVTDGEGRSSVDGIWAAGRITGTHHQALVSAGDGARVALNLVGEPVPDVLRRLGRTRGVLQQHGRSIPVGVEEISHDERTRRAEHGREWPIEFFELQQSP